MENNIDKYKLSNMRKFLIWIENYEFGDPIIESIEFARYCAMDQFASNIVACNDKDFSEGQDFLFGLSMNTTTENQLKEYLLKQKKLILKHISTRGYHMGTHLYQLYLQFLFDELSDEEKEIFLENYIEMIKELCGDKVANQKNICLIKRLGFIENTKISIPYPIGTYLDKIEDGKRHIDQLCEYIVTENGIFAVLVLDVWENPRLSTRISIEELNNKWTLSQDVHFNVSEEDVRTTCESFNQVRRKTM